MKDTLYPLSFRVNAEEMNLIEDAMSAMKLEALAIESQMPNRSDFIRKAVIEKAVGIVKKNQHRGGHRKDVRRLG